MSDRRRFLLLPVAVLLAVTLAVAGCGRRGAPEPPGMAATGAAVDDDVREPSRDTAPDRPFLLDPLL